MTDGESRGCRKHAQDQSRDGESQAVGGDVHGFFQVGIGSENLPVYTEFDGAERLTTRDDPGQSVEQFVEDGSHDGDGQYGNGRPEDLLEPLNRLFESAGGYQEEVQQEGDGKGDYHTEEIGLSHGDGEVFF